MGLFGGCNNGGGDRWIWIIVIIVLVLCCCDIDLFGGNKDCCCEPCCEPCDPCSEHKC